MNKFEDLNMENIQGEKCTFDWSTVDFSELELEDELSRTFVAIDIDRLAKSKVKQIVVCLSQFIEWQCLDLSGKPLRKNDMAENCLPAEEAEKAKTLNRMNKSRVWDLLDEDVKKDMTFENFVN